MKKIFFLLITYNLLLATLTAQPKYEFRGVWVATVDNIDWPSSKYLSTDTQRAEFIRLLDMHQRNGMNAIIAQIRPAADAFYYSQFEPWSEWLTGTQGKPPAPLYDPLEFMINETHKRGMEFHAWMNPYRAEFKINSSSISPTHVTKLFPEWFLNYGSIKLFDPGNKEVQKYVVSVVKDIVSRYDIDAIHFDDYFYPYRIAGKEFPDTASYSKYGNGMSKDDWRRSNVDSIIFMLSRAIKQTNKYCKFGISPFGVWRNADKDAEGSNTKAGQTNYDDLYADILLWLKNKWIDYAAPQLYWEFSQPKVPFATLIDWWSKHTYGRQLYIGHGVYRAFETRSTAWKNPSELPNQIKKVREYPQIQGSIYFSSKTFDRNPNGWNDSLQNNYYKYPALIPPMPWIDSVKAAHPILSPIEVLDSFASHEINIHIHITNFQPNIRQYAIYILSKDPNPILTINNNNIYKLIPAAKDIHLTIPETLLSPEATHFYFTITSISKTNNESKVNTWYYFNKTVDGWKTNYSKSILFH